MKNKIIGSIIVFLLASALVFGIPALQVLYDGTVVVEENLNVKDNLILEGSMNLGGSLTVNGVENASVPRGAIIMWSGSDLPTGWALCDGQNGTPDLRDKFILGISENEVPGDEGGNHSKDILLLAEEVKENNI